MGPPVGYECIAPSHRIGDGGPDKLTIHAGQWAFCPYDAKATGHQWIATGGLPLPVLRHAAALRLRDPEKDPAGVR